MTAIVVFLLIITVLWYAIRPRTRVEPVQRFSERKHWALSLAEPMVKAVGMTGFYEPTTHCFADESKTMFRAPLLHQMGYRNQASDEHIRAHLTSTLEQQWFSLDLDQLGHADDPRSAMAFACVRTAFLVRCAMLFNWLPPETGWRILLLNAQRAQDCFSSWTEFGQAFITGRQQWVLAFRADPLGGHFDDNSLTSLQAPRTGAWSGLPWHELPAMYPTAG